MTNEKISDFEHLKFINTLWLLYDLDITTNDLKINILGVLFNSILVTKKNIFLGREHDLISLFTEVDDVLSKNLILWILYHFGNSEGKKIVYDNAYLAKQLYYEDDDIETKENALVLYKEIGGQEGEDFYNQEIAKFK